jgi:serine/threonine-protein kinase
MPPAGMTSSMPPAPARTSAPVVIPALPVRADIEDPLLGQTIQGRVKIIRPIARGGMGKVYYGEQVSMGRAVAIKVLDPHMAGAEVAEFNKRFLLEASVSSKLTHPNVVTIFDYGETDDGLCFIAMEYLEGCTLAEELKKFGKLPPERAVGIARQVCRALREAHALGVVHRDMKPGNVFLVKHDDEGDFAKVLDFGLVKETHPADGNDQHTQVGQVMGSPRYMAPEQIQGKPVDSRTDIYSLGAMLFTMLCGRPPFDKPNEMSTMMAHVSEPVPFFHTIIPDVMMPEELELIVRKCLEKEPAKRFNSMEEVISALKLQGGSGLATIDSGNHVAVSNAALFAPSSLMPPEEPPPASNTPKVVGIVLMLGAAAAATWFFLKPPDAPPVIGGPTPPPATSTIASVAPPTPSPSVEAPPVPSAILRVVTDPPGARVKEDNLVVCPSTPCDIVYKGAQADPTIEHLLTIQKADYDTAKKLAKVSASPLTVKLTKDR